MKALRFIIDVLKPDPPMSAHEWQAIALAAVIWGAMLAVLAFLAGTARGELPPVPRPNNQPITAQSVELGRKLFFDPILSDDGTVSCATCHNPDLGWSDGQRVAIGVRGQAGTRNSPTIVNAAYQRFMFHDARTLGTTTQSLLPILNPVEMGNQTEQQVMAKVLGKYGQDLVLTFGFPRGGFTQPNLANMYAKAIADFETTVISGDAPVDRALAGDESVLSDKARAGLQHFVKADCMACHPAPLFTDGRLHNNGMPFVFGRMQGGLVFVADQGATVQGRRRLFKTPTLREIHRTSPYVHNGGFRDLKRVVQHYNAGGAAVFAGQRLRDPQIDQRIRPLGLTAAQEDELVAFLAEGFAGRDYPNIPRP